MRHINKTLLVLLISISSCPGCFFSYQSLEYKRALAALDHKDFEEGFSLLERVIKRNANSTVALDAARRGAKSAFLDAKNYKRAVYFNQQLVLNSPDQNERMVAQKQIAQLQFESLANYEQAIVEYNKLLALPRTPQENTEYRFNIAKAYYQLNNFYQAKVEADELLAHPLLPERKFEVLLFKANLLLADKKLDAATEAYSNLLGSFPQQAKKENVPLNLAVCYEEKGDFTKAIRLLEELRVTYPTPEFIDLKIRRLQERAANLPGAEGLKK